MSKPTDSELSDSLGQLLACFSIPAGADEHDIRFNLPIEEIEMRYLKALSVVTRFYHPNA